MRFDAEQFVKNLETNVKANLNAEITQLNTDKGDSLLSTLDSEAFYMQDIKSSAYNYDPICLIYVNDATLEEFSFDASINTYEIYLIIGYSEQNDINNGYRLLRYQKAIENYIAKNQNKVFRGVKASVNSLNPITLVLNESKQMNAVGVALEITIG